MTDRFLLRYSGYVSRGVRQKADSILSDEFWSTGINPARRASMNQILTVKYGGLVGERWCEQSTSHGRVSNEV